MLTLTKLRSKPAAFRSLTGLTLPQYEQLFAEVAERYAVAEAARLTRPQRQRARGAGRKYKLSLEDRLLLALVWLRVYPTYEVLGLLFDLDKGAVCRNLDRMLTVLRQVTAVDLSWPADGQRQRRWADLLTDFPDVTAIIDATEQRIQRPQGQAAQKPYYSGKKKSHTLKTQVQLAPDGGIQDVSDSVPGSVHDLTLLRQHGTLARQDAGAIMFDRGYQGVQKDAPDRQLYHPYRASRGQPLTPEQKAWNQLLSHYRIRVEHTLGQLKVYEVLTQVYRHRRERYNRVFFIVAALTNRRLGFGFPQGS
jgi:hypothetical protein